MKPRNSTPPFSLASHAWTNCREGPRSGPARHTSGVAVLRPWIVAAAIGVTSGSGLAQTIWCVDAQATGANDDSSWCNAFTSLQPALANASTGHQIWIARGTCMPGVLESGTFTMKDGVILRGGFPGNAHPNGCANAETDPDPRAQPSGATGIELDEVRSRDNHAVQKGGGLYAKEAQVGSRSCVFRQDQVSELPGGAGEGAGWGLPVPTHRRTIGGRAQTELQPATMAPALHTSYADLAGTYLSFADQMDRYQVITLLYGRNQDGSLVIAYLDALDTHTGEPVLVDKLASTSFVFNELGEVRDFCVNYEVRGERHRIIIAEAEFATRPDGCVGFYRATVRHTSGGTQIMDFSRRWSPLLSDNTCDELFPISYFRCVTTDCLGPHGNWKCPNMTPTCPCNALQGSCQQEAFFKCLQPRTPCAPPAECKAVPGDFGTVCACTNP